MNKKSFRINFYRLKTPLLRREAGVRTIISNNLILFFLSVFIFSCGNSTTIDSVEIKEATPVTVTKISSGALSETIELSATSSFLQKTLVKSNSSGYINDLKTKPGEFVSKGQILFTIKSKEATSLGNVINKIDSSFHFKGITEVKSPTSGYISELNYANGDFVQEGEQISIINDASSFAFVLKIPYEQISLLKNNSTVQLHLPDGNILNAIIDKSMPTVDATTQTQNILLRVQSDEMIPENLIAKVLLVKTEKQNAVILPREAVLASETQNEFWVIKLLNDSTAIKISVIKGIESSDAIEIISPTFSADDKFLLTGNYGLPDTASVHIENEK